MTTGDFDAVVLATTDHAQARVLGLSLVERGRRVALTAGARRVLVIDGATSAAALPRWWAEGGAATLLVIRAGDQVVHRPLVEPLLAGAGDRRLAVDRDGGYRGALWARGEAAGEVIDALAATPDGGDAALVRRWREAGATIDAIVPGAIARHPAMTRAERAAAARMLLGLLVKAEDGVVTRWIYRPISRPMTRLLVGTPVTPNQVSIAAGILGLIGCWFTARPGQASLVAGAALVLFAGFLDGCDGEIARLRLETSKLGAWIDTVVDELTTTAYFVALGYHTHLHLRWAWIVPATVAVTVLYVAIVYAIYHFLVVVAKSGNSQHYVRALKLVDDPIAGVGLRPVPDAISTTPRPLLALAAFVGQLVKRDTVNVVALVVACLDGYFALFLGMLIGGVLTAAGVLPAHVRLRRQLRALARRGAPPRLLSAR